MNSTPRSASKTKAYLKETKIQFIGNVPYSLGLALCYIYLCPKVKKSVRGTKFTSVSVVWFQKMNKCIECKCDYLKKYVCSRFLILKNFQSDSSMLDVVLDLALNRSLDSPIALRIPGTKAWNLFSDLILYFKNDFLNIFMCNFFKNNVLLHNK